MTAKEMFAELGYEEKNNNPVKYIKDDGGYIQQIMFSEVGRRIILREWEEYNNFEPQGQFTLYLDEIQAINQQCKELGWFDENTKIS